MYTILTTMEDEGPIVCKLHFPSQKLEEETYRYWESEVNKIRAAFDLYRHPNVLPYDRIFNV
jgi:phosphoinositide-3-kinase, regulatory subunit 4